MSKESGSRQAALAGQTWAALGGDPGLMNRLAFAGEGELPSAFAVSDLAAASIGVAALAVAGLVEDVGGDAPNVVVDLRLASFWFSWSLRPIGWTIPPAWDPIAGDYQTADGWIRLHTNAPRHRAAALRVLGVPEERSVVEQAVRRWSGDNLEAEVVQAGGCAAVMRSISAWREHPQGVAVASEPLILPDIRPGSSFRAWRPTEGRPLDGLKVLDLTRVLAGPIATRFLAGYGADVLRIDPPDWDEPGAVPEVTVGKRCARLDLADSRGRAVFERLLATADLVVHGYRPGALNQLGFGSDIRRRLAPDLIEVTLDAYGWSGPWAKRRGFDSLVQMSAGLAHAGMQWKSTETPTPLPVQALDHATGYLMAAAAVQAIRARLMGQGCTTARLSLARTAQLLVNAPISASPPFKPEVQDDLAPSHEATSWGDARRLFPPVIIGGAEMRWTRPASKLGDVAASWAS